MGVIFDFSPASLEAVVHRGSWFFWDASGLVSAAVTVAFEPLVRAKGLQLVGREMVPLHGGGGVAQVLKTVHCLRVRLRSDVRWEVEGHFHHWDQQAGHWGCPNKGLVDATNP